MDGRAMPGLAAVNLVHIAAAIFQSKGYILWEENTDKMRLLRNVGLLHLWHYSKELQYIPSAYIVDIILGYLTGITGEYITPKGYAVCDEHPNDFAVYEVDFPYKENLKLPGQIFG